MGWIKHCILVGWLATVAAVSRADNPPPAADSKEAEIADRVGKLIEVLGSEDFAARERSQAELAKLGLEAYDALHAAQSHHDPEIALRARYLVRSMNVRWFSDSDSPKVVQLLRDYGDLKDDEKRNRIEKLTELEGDAGMKPLIRLARFETSDPVAKYAALTILNAEPPEGQVAKSDLAKVISGIVANSKRPAAFWLNIYARTLTDPLSALADWDQATQAEHALLTKTPERTSREIVRDLYRFQIELLNRLERSDEAMAVIRRTFTLIDPAAEQLHEIVDWLMHREAWPIALEVMEQFKANVEDDAQLLYRLATVHAKIDHPDEAAAAAAKALALRPENLEEHNRVGRWLDEYLPGSAKWAEAEYRQVLKSAAPGSIPDFAARFRLSDLLHDRLEELPAAEMLKPICDLMQKDEASKENCYRARRAPEGVISRMHYYFSCHDREAGDLAKEKEHLKSAIDSDDTDADVLIAMYRYPQPDEAWKALTKEKLESAVTTFRALVSDRKAAMDQADNDQSRDDARYEYAIACNQYAWLVGNTYGDMQDAIKLSHESVVISQRLLTLKPNYPGFLDTLGRCCYGAGDLPNAVKYQSMAVALSPDSGQIRRQLDYFKKEAASRGVEVKEAEPPPVTYERPRIPLAPATRSTPGAPPPQPRPTPPAAPKSPPTEPKSR